MGMGMGIMPPNFLKAKFILWIIIKKLNKFKILILMIFKSLIWVKIFKHYYWNSTDKIVLPKRDFGNYWVFSHDYYLSY